MTSKVVKTPKGYFLEWRDEEGRIITPGRIHLPPNPELEKRVHRAWQDYFRQRYETEQAAKA